MFTDHGYGSSDTTPCQTLLHCLLLMVVFDATSRSYYTSRKAVTSRLYYTSGKADSSRSMLYDTVPHRENTNPQSDVNEERFTLIIAASKTQNMSTGTMVMRQVLLPHVGLLTSTLLPYFIPVSLSSTLP